MLNCKVCEGEKLSYWLNSKLVCLKCDELTFDIEIECDEESLTSSPQQQPKQPKLVPLLIKKTG